MSEESQLRRFRLDVHVGPSQVQPMSVTLMLAGLRVVIEGVERVFVDVYALDEDNAISAFQQALEMRYGMTFNLKPKVLRCVDGERNPHDSLPIKPDSSAIQSLIDYLTKTKDQLDDLANDELEPNEGETITEDRKNRSELYEMASDLIYCLRGDLLRVAHGVELATTVQTKLTSGPYPWKS